MSSLVGKACLTCNHVGLVPPSDWAPAYDGQRYDKYAARKIIRENNGFHAQAQCTVDPAWIEVSTGHYCGRWEGDAKVEPVDEFIWGSFIRRQHDELSDQVQTLKKRLKNAQRVSASRLARLKRDKKT